MPQEPDENLPLLTADFLSKREEGDQVTRREGNLGGRLGQGRRSKKEGRLQLGVDEAMASEISAKREKRRL